MTENTIPSESPGELTYSEAGVDSVAKESGLRALLASVNQTRQFRKGVGEARLEIGYFANVVDIGHGDGLAITTDTVGTKALIAQMVGQYDNIGIDCVAINVNDILCVGAEPIAMVDCITLEEPRTEMLDGIGKGLRRGAEIARISIVGGELAQVKDMVKGHRPGFGFDLAGTCVGIVRLDRIIEGESIKEGDSLIGLRSSGIHCNGLSLARKALFGNGKYTPDQVIPSLGRTIGEELLKPTQIYSNAVGSLLDSEIRIKALVHVTGDGGLLNLTRTKSDVGYVIEQFPEPQAIFALIKEARQISDAEMFRVYNMGIGFCVVVDPDDTDKAIEILGESDVERYLIGYAVADKKRQLNIKPHGLIGTDGRFVKG